MGPQKLKISPINFNQTINSKDFDLFTLFVAEQGKIFPRRITGLTAQQQRKLAKAIKHARILSIFPFVASNSI